VDQLLFRECFERGIVKTSPLQHECEKRQYQGATVLEPRAGLYGGYNAVTRTADNQCVATLDFASLYPTVMIAHNLGYMTLVERGYVCASALVAGAEVHAVLCADSGLPQSAVTPARGTSRLRRLRLREVRRDGAAFTAVCDDGAELVGLPQGTLNLNLPGSAPLLVHAVLPTSVETDTLNEAVFVTTVEGIVPAIVKKLLKLRAGFRHQIKQLQGQPGAAVAIDMLDNAQKAAKVIANSVRRRRPCRALHALSPAASQTYGFTCAYRYPKYEIGEAVTWKSRQMLAATKAGAEACGYRVIYGDTDSIMVEMPHGVAETFPIAQELAAKLSELFPPPVLLEFEKIYQPCVLRDADRTRTFLTARAGTCSWGARCTPAACSRSPPTRVAWTSRASRPSGATAPAGAPASRSSFLRPSSSTSSATPTPPTKP
jgi:DNA polymerase elongation subunit (family B)